MWLDVMLMVLMVLLNLNVDRDGATYVTYVGDATRLLLMMV